MFNFSVTWIIYLYNASAKFELDPVFLDVVLDLVLLKFVWFCTWIPSMRLVLAPMIVLYSLSFGFGFVKNQNLTFGFGFGFVENQN